MAFGGCFEQWQRDVFFSAAEEVQESTDKMESAYYMWIRNPKFDLEASEELRRELQAALGTAKWQLEEFEKAVKLSHARYYSEGNAISRHRQFITAIEHQILQVEKGLNDSLIEEGKQPLRWVQLDKEEQDDLANFLSGVPQSDKQGKTVDYDSFLIDKSIKGTIKINKDKTCVVEVAEREPRQGKCNPLPTKLEQCHGQTRVLSSPDISGAWKIAIADEDTNEVRPEIRPEILRNESGRMRNADSTSKWNEFRNSWWKSKKEDNHHLSSGLAHYLDLRLITRFVKGFTGWTERSRIGSQVSKHSHSQHLVGKVGGFHRRSGGSQQHVHFIRYLWMTFLLVLTVVLVVPFVLYSA